MVLRQPQIEAREALFWVQVLTVASPECDASYRKAMIARWSSLAAGLDPEYDSSGARIIRSGRQLRAWFVTEGGFSVDEIS